MRKRCASALGAFVLITQLCSSAIPCYADGLGNATEASLLYKDNTASSSVVKDTEVSSRFLELLFGKKKKPQNHIEKATEEPTLMLCPGGDVFGIRIVKEAVSVVESDEECILKYGDIIISIDGKAIRSLSDIKEILNNSDGKPLNLVVERSGERFEAQVVPKTEDGKYKLGAVLKDGVAGIGTVTYFNPETGDFGGLGHGICEQGSSEPVKMKSGSVCGVILGGIDKSEEGDPGELSGVLTEGLAGELYSNTSEGVFGKFNTPPDVSRIALPVAKKSEVHEGEAVIYSTVRQGRREEYRAQIFDIDPSSDGPKSFKVRITDETLKAMTGGIVRGMSGSPIIQDGRIIGALTHVMVSKPSEGYGIFIENMLEASGAIPQRRAA